MCPNSPAGDVETIRRERDYFKQQMDHFKQQMEYFRQQVQSARAAPVVPGLGMAMDSDRASMRGPLTRVCTSRLVGLLNVCFIKRIASLLMKTMGNI